jgi:hypothetical protein
MDISHFDYCLENCTSVIESYQEMEEKHMGGGFMEQSEQMMDAYRFKPVI